jgi:SAM-dependent methyltransferase
LSFLEIIRVLKPTGLFYLNVPSNGDFHRYPVDCWRFYPDSGRALERWAKANGFKPAMLESFTGKQRWDVWNDFVAVFVKDEAHASLYPARIQDSIRAFSNGLVHGSEEIHAFSLSPEDATMGIMKRYGRRSVWAAADLREWLYWRFHRLPQRIWAKLRPYKSASVQR